MKGVNTGETVEVSYESSYQNRPGTVTGVVKEVKEDSIVLLENGLNWREVFEYEHDDSTLLLRGAKARGDLGCRHGTTMGTVVDVQEVSE